MKQPHVPSPHEAATRLGRVFRFLNLTFEVQLPDGVWRTVRVGQHRPLFNEAKPDLSLLLFKLDPWVPTPYLPSIGGEFYASQHSFARGFVEWVPTPDMAHLARRVRPGSTVRVGFRACNDDAAAWFVLLLAKAARARYRNKQLMSEDRYEYRQMP